MSQGESKSKRTLYQETNNQWSDQKTPASILIKDTLNHIKIGYNSRYRSCNQPFTVYFLIRAQFIGHCADASGDPAYNTMRLITTRYLSLAEQVATDLSLEEMLPTMVTDFPPLTLTELDGLAADARQLGLAQPRLAWSLLAVAAAAQSQAPPFIQAKAAWYLGQAANEWVQPGRVTAALDHAESIFADLGEAGWVAACQWQRNALPWTRPNFYQSCQELAAALTGLEAHPDMYPFAPHCRLALAYAHLLINEFDQALALIQASQADFTAQGDSFNAALCWFTQAACHRRQSQFEAALTAAETALAAFTRLNAAGYIARTRCMIGLIYRAMVGDYTAAEQHLIQANELFQQLDMPLWSSQCQLALGQIYNKTGRFTQAQEILDIAIPSLREHQLFGLLGDALLDRATTEIARGNYTQASQWLQEASQLAEQVGMTNLLYLAENNQAVVSMRLGRYQDALALLEKTAHYFEHLDIWGRVSQTELTLASLWLELGQPTKAQSCLDNGLAHSELAQQNDLHGEFTITRAAALFKQNKVAAAIHTLEQWLQHLHEPDHLPEIAAIHRWLAEMWCENPDPTQAVYHLQEAESRFNQMGLVMELAVVKLLWGRYYQKMGQTAEARAAWEQALNLSQELMPEINWQAQARLADLAQQTSDPRRALSHYEKMLDHLVRLREGFAQSALSGAFFSRPEQDVDRAVHLAVTLHQSTDALRFIEASKAITLARLLHTDNYQYTNLPAAYSDHLADLIAEIRWLQDKQRLKIDGDRPPSFTEQRQLQQRLKQKANEYDDLLNKLERMVRTDQLAAIPSHRFDLSLFRRQAAGALGGSWVAIDYYLTEQHLLGVMVTPTQCTAWQTPISSITEMSLRLVKKANPDNTGYSEADYKRLADLLFPPWLCELLTPETTLLLAPHEALHRLPWPALWLESFNAPLVDACVPVLVPSLNSLTVLWQRGRQQPPTTGKQLLIAVSDFQGRHEPLPAVQREAMQLLQQGKGKIEERCDAAATWPNIQQLSNGHGLQRFDWLHIASHAFYDNVTGRLSGLAFYDQDIWIDDLLRLAPLPRLVTLSVCSSRRDHVYAGDEQVGLTASCLVAGAQTVISSLWPVVDETAPDLLLHFYQSVASGRSPAQALALAQRNARKQGMHVNQWSSFCCVGQP